MDWIGVFQRHPQTWLHMVQVIRRFVQIRPSRTGQKPLIPSRPYQESAWRTGIGAEGRRKTAPNPHLPNTWDSAGLFMAGRMQKVMMSFLRKVTLSHLWFPNGSPLSTGIARAKIRSEDPFCDPLV